MMLIKVEWIGHDFFIRLEKLRALSRISVIFNCGLPGRKKALSKSKEINSVLSLSSDVKERYMQL